MSPEAPRPDIPATTEVTLLAGRYQVFDKLGEGGMGAVFHARDTKLDRAVSVKMLPTGKLTDAEAVARFQREAKALARLSHPGIIQVHDSGGDSGNHFLVMELVDGRSRRRPTRSGTRSRRTCWNCSATKRWRRRWSTRTS